MWRLVWVPTTTEITVSHISRTQIRNLLEPRQDPTGQEIRIFSAQGLQDLQFSTQSCQAIFEEIEIELKKASKQIEGKKAIAGKVTLSLSESAKWPFLQPKMDRLRADLRDSKLNLQLMLSITTLANAQMLSPESVVLDPIFAGPLKLTCRL